MGLLGDVSAWIDNRKRVAAGNLRDLQSGLLAPQWVAQTQEDLNQFGQGLLADPSGAGMTERWMPIAMMAHTVYHGSPYKFDKFDASKIGTGEGAQAYGHGLYLAENAGVAKSYRDAGQGGIALQGVDGERYGMPQDAAMKIARKWFEYKKVNPDEMHYFRVKEPKGGADLIINDILDGKIKEGGALYKVDLPDEWLPKMLDWDKPLSQQPEAVRAFVNGGVEGAGMQSRSAAHQVRPPAAADLRLSNDSTGADIYLALKRFQGEQSGDRISAFTGNYVGDPGGAVADALRQQGIPGIRYLDGGSRGQGQGTYNYVVFPGMEGLLKILERQ